MKNYILVFAGLIFSISTLAQDEDLLNLVDKDSAKTEYVTSAFKSSRVIMSHSMEMLQPGVLDFRILHRFGNINRGAYEFFGLDDATIRLGLDYALGRNLTVGIGRASHKKELDGFLKWRAIQQKKGERNIPVSILLVAGSTINTLKWSIPDKESHFRYRMGYYGQVIIGRKFSEAFTLQLAPILVHQNLVPTTQDNNDQFALGTGARLRLTKRISLNVDHYLVFNKNKVASLHNPLSMGFDIETGGHVFQLHFTNAIGMNERTFLNETTNDWSKGDIQFGFNISRAFQIKRSNK